MSRIEKLLELLKTAETDSFLQHALALEYIKTGDDERARVLFNSLLSREPGYVGSYYHLAKLLERAKEYDAAIDIYKKGLQEAQKANDRHSYNELQMALEEIEE
ncbi:MAG: tetratricopeptide repeat protein [Bacteroidetes bacterium]|nr:tetratricopeptide repeat protein [Bacteroidota bacterium]MBS1756423.1 tetratricopeptide repeat protein [Bacteroidota bacterium]